MQTLAPNSKPAEQPGGVRPALVAVLIAALVVVAYLPVLRNGFVNWDDDIYVLDNDAVRAPDGLRRIWSTTELPAHFPNYPLVFTSYWVEYRLWGTGPAGYHLTNVVLHAVNTLLVFALVLALGASPWAAGVTAALFGLHPMQVESVAWVTERKNVLSTCFAVLTLLAYVRYRQSGRRTTYCLVVAAFVCALLSKTAVVVLPLSLLLFDRFRDGRFTRRSVYRVAPLLLLAALAGVVTLGAESSPLTVPPAERPLLAAACLWFYAGKLIVPWNLTPVYPRWDTSSALAWWGLALIGLAAAGFATWRWVKDWRARWGLSFFVCMLLPVLGLRSYGFNEYSFVADRNVYLACVGLLLAMALAADGWRAARGRGVTLVTVLVLACLLGMTLRQIAVWRDSITLWTAVLARNPSAVVAHSNLGLALIDAGRLDEAAAHLRTALAAAPDDPEAHTNLGLVLYRRGDLHGAEEHCRRALAVRPDAAEFHKNLGLVLEAQGNAAAAEQEYRQAIHLQDSAVYRYRLGNVLLQADNPQAALVEYQHALQRDPEMDEARHDSGRCFLALGRPSEAATAFAVVVQRHPDWAEARYNFAFALRQLGRRDEAIHQLEVVLQQRPEFSIAREQLDAIRSPQGGPH